MLFDQPINAIILEWATNTVALPISFSTLGQSQVLATATRSILNRTAESLFPFPLCGEQQKSQLIASLM